MTDPARRTYADGPVYMTGTFPIPDAIPAPGCSRCVQLAEQRTAARVAGDHSAASDANVLLRRHPH